MVAPRNSADPVIANPEQAAALEQSLAASHARDLERIARGDLKPSDLHFIPKAAAKRARIDWSKQGKG